MKTACFATSAILLIKNAASGINGQSLARQKVMERYKTKCDTDPKYSSMTHTECYGKLSSEIEADVKSTTAGINKVNDIIDEKVKGAPKTEGVFENSVIDQPALVDDLKKSINAEWKTEVNGEEVKTAVHLFQYSGKNYLAVLIGGADKQISDSYYLDNGNWVKTKEPDTLRDFG